MRHPFQMPPQLLRILLLVVGIVVSYSIARYFLTPATFGQYGWYRGAALAQLADRERVYAGKKGCEECHSDTMQKLLKDGHKTLSCESCHGPGLAHADNPDVKIDKNHYSPCIRCHEANPSRPKWHKQIVTKTHYTGSKCTECHMPHMPSEVP
jgi:hypothetical protein